MVPPWAAWDGPPWRGECQLTLSKELVTFAQFLHGDAVTTEAYRVEQLIEQCFASSSEAFSARRS